MLNKYKRIIMLTGTPRNHKIIGRIGNYYPIQELKRE